MCLGESEESILCAFSVLGALYTITSLILRAGGCLLAYNLLPSFIIILTHVQLKLSVYVYVDHVLLLSVTSEPCQGPGNVGAQYVSM